MANPIWKDYFVNLGSGASMIYRIKEVATNKVIYTGKAYKRPNETSIKVRVNDICADYIAKLPMSASCPSFKVQIYTSAIQGQDPDWQDLTINAFKFVFDWSYDYITDRISLSAPVSRKVAPTQPIIYCCTYSTIDIDIEYEDGSEDSDQLSGTASPYGGYIYRVIPEDYGEDIVKVTLDRSEVYEVVRNCNEYALVYRNAFGGYDSLLIEGNHLETDNLERHTSKVEEANTSRDHRHTRNIANEVTKTFTLHTGWLTDAQSANMHHLLNSTDVYLYDLADATQIPVILTNATTEHKTYKSNGNRLVNYDIQVEVAQNMMRR